jgi:hypothetical protein
LITDCHLLEFVDSLGGVFFFFFFWGGGGGGVIWCCAVDKFDFPCSRKEICFLVQFLKGDSTSFCHINSVCILRVPLPFSSANHRNRTANVDL